MSRVTLDIELRMQRKIVLSVGEFYHVYNRGVEKRRVFLTKKDHGRFQRLLFLANGTAPLKFDRVKDLQLKDIDRGTPLVAIGAYVMMPNHFHILLKEIRQGGISLFMEKLTTAYAAYFNKRNDRVGSLFQGTYKAQHADTDEYLKYLFAYIHLNPIKLIELQWKEEGIKDQDKAREFLVGYKYSSYIDYAGIEREESRVLAEDKDAFPEYFLVGRDFEDFINDWLSYREESESV
jgi:putative transposase